ncbi:MAG: hypothetical protein U0324_29235 [Polyangiales bacterium]
MLPADDLVEGCCAETIARVLSTASADACPTCGTVYLPPDDAANDAAGDARPSRVRAPSPAPLSEAIADVALALRWRREARAVAVGSARSPLAPLQGRSSGAETDASAATTAWLWRLVTEPSSKVGRKARAGFVDALVRHCSETSRPDEDEPDWAAARAHAVRLAALERAHREALRAVAARCRPDVAWDVACLVVADECAPAELRATWTGVYRALDGAGRPRVDRTAPPAHVAARAWGDRELRAALAAWGASARA